jgi:hypothetical protein
VVAAERNVQLQIEAAPGEQPRSVPPSGDGSGNAS